MGKTSRWEGEGPKFRNTPTSVGKTNKSGRLWKVVRKHPHERGEDYGAGIVDEEDARNTPTSVGKTGTQL